MISIILSKIFYKTIFPFLESLFFFLEYLNLFYVIHYFNTLNSKEITDENVKNLTLQEDNVGNILHWKKLDFKSLFVRKDISIFRL